MRPAPRPIPRKRQKPRTAPYYTLDERALIAIHQRRKVKKTPGKQATNKLSALQYIHINGISRAIRLNISVPPIHPSIHPRRQLKKEKKKVTHPLKPSTSISKTQDKKDQQEVPPSKSVCKCTTRGLDQHLSVRYFSLLGFDSNAWVRASR